MANSPAVLACVVLAHEDPAHVRRLVEALDPFPVFLHVDARTTDDVHAAMTADLPDRVRLLPRMRTGWAKWENVAAELAGYRAALAESGATHIAVLTGSDYPLANPAEITALLAANPDRTFLITHPFPHAAWGASGGYARLRYPHWAWRKHMLRVPVPRRIPRDVVPTGGSQLKVISAAHAQAVLDVVDARPDLVRFWRRAWIADESFVPSVLSSPTLVPGFADQQVDDSLWFIGWDGSKMKSPPWLRTEHAGRLLERWTTDPTATPHLFARKFSTAVSSDLLDIVDAAFELRQDVPTPEVGVA